MTILTTFAQTRYPNNFMLSCGIFGAIPVLEMALRVFVDLCKMGLSEDKKLFDYHNRNASRDLGCSVFYGLLAANVVPGSAVLGVTVFTGYSIWKHYFSEIKEYYLTSWLLVRGTEFILFDVFAREILAGCQQIVWPAFEFLLKKIIKPFWQNYLHPLLQKIKAVVGNVFKSIGQFVAKISSPPVWINVALLGAAIVTYKVALPLLFAGSL